MDINIQPKQSSMSASTVSAVITLTTEEIVVNTTTEEIVVNTSTNAADDYTLSQYKEAQKELEEMIGIVREFGIISDYEELVNKPSIEGVELVKNITFSQLGMDRATNEDILSILRR